MSIWYNIFSHSAAMQTYALKELQLSEKDTK